MKESSLIRSSSEKFGAYCVGREKGQEGSGRGRGKGGNGRGRKDGEEEKKNNKRVRDLDTKGVQRKIKQE